MQSKYIKTNMVCRFKLVRLIVNLSFLCFQKENGQLTSGIQSRTGVHGSNPTSQRSQEVPHDEVQRFPQHRHLQMEPGQHLLKQSFIFLSNLLHQKKFSLIFRNINLAKNVAILTDFFQVRMVRENNRREFVREEEEQPEFGAGSEFGRKEKEEARRKKYGINTRKYNPDNQPW